MEKKILCIFCSSSDALPKVYFEESKQIGILSARAQYDLIYGGGKIGLMGEVARAFKSEKAKTTGVIPEKLNLQNVVNQSDDEILATKTMSERKKIMFDKAYGFIALPGGDSER